MERTRDEDAAISCLVREFEHLAGTGEEHAMLAHHLATAQGRKADGARWPDADLSVAAAHLNLRQFPAASSRRGMAQRQRCAGGRIDFQAMMHLEDLDVV